MGLLLGRLHRLERVQRVKLSLDAAWDFFSEPRNLARITPPSMGFHVLAGADEPMFAGQIIEYRVHPFPGVPVTWVTEITHVEPRVSFVDEQRFGPYRLWHHRHSFREVGGGVVELGDHLHYVLPMGFLGDVVAPWLVRPRLEAIFAYRAKVLSELFGAPS